MAVPVQSFRSSATYSEALRAWFDGEFELCLELCSLVRTTPRSGDVALLSARALLRLGRSEDAIDVLEPATASLNDVDAAVTAEMLLGSAHIRLGRSDLGLSILRPLLGAKVHQSIRSEVSLNIALAHYVERDLVAAAAALDEVDADDDIIFARALEYRGWISTAETKTAEAAQYFLDALDHLRLCAHRDRFLESNCLRALGHIAVEQLDEMLWLGVRDRAMAFDWSAGGLGEPRFWFTMSAALASEMLGDTPGAFHFSRQAVRIAPSAPLCAHAYCRRALIAHRAGERIEAADSFAAALGEVKRVDMLGLSGDNRTMVLTLAETAAVLGQNLEAARLLAAYRAGDKRDGRYSMDSGDARLIAYEALVAAEIQFAAGNETFAIPELRSAYDGFRALGFARRAVEAANLLGGLEPTDEIRRYVIEATRQLPANSWFRQRAFESDRRPFSDGVLRGLTETQRSVLMLVCDGLSNPAIAAARNRSPQTIRNMVSDLLTAFGVANRQELIVACARRGITSSSRKMG